MKTLRKGEFHSVQAQHEIERGARYALHIEGLDMAMFHQQALHQRHGDRKESGWYTNHSR
jgi:hypothetical protein